MSNLKIFISYSWDSPSHREWVKKLADDLEAFEEIHVTWDGYDLDSLVDKNFFMEEGVHSADFIVVVATNEYKKKADGRTGGAGLETYMATSVHWESMLAEKRSRVLVVRRETEGVPRYLAGHFYINFEDDSAYPVKFAELVTHLRGASVHERPAKRKSLTIQDVVPDFTRVEELIKVNHANRKLIVSREQGTDFSGSNRIKYEIWETKSPAVGYYVALHPNVNIAQTARRAAASFIDKKLRPLNLTVLRHRGGRPDQKIFASAFSAQGLTPTIHDCTYREYVWEYCIDDSLKSVDPPSGIDNYTNQNLLFASLDGTAPETVESALDYLVDALQKPSATAAHLVVAPGGMGKTSLCLSVAKKLHSRNDLRSSVVLIQAESIKKYVAERGGAGPRVDSIYDIYELYARQQGHGQIFDRTTFDLAVVCGNITVIIDGLDELASLFGEKFDVKSFLLSLNQLHHQLGSSSILLTTRSNIIAEGADLEALSIRRYDLLGFNVNDLSRYVKRRLNHYPDSDALVKKVMSQVGEIKLNDGDDRVIPFLADIVTTVVEDEFVESGAPGFVVIEDSTPYYSNNDLTDHIVYSVLRREQTRHGLEISVSEVVDLISGLVADFGRRWLASELQSRLHILYEAHSASLYNKILLNPLLMFSGEYVELRYSFLASYFEVLLMIQGVIRSSIELEAVRSLSRLNLDSEEAADLKRFFGKNPEIVKAALESLIPKLRDISISADDATQGARWMRDCSSNAISALLCIFFAHRKLSAEEVSEQVLGLYGVTGSNASQRTIAGLFLSGEFPVFDFSNLTVTRSRFVRYKKFMWSKFDNSKFMYSVFEGCADDRALRPSLDLEMIDSTCDAGDLRDALSAVRNAKSQEAALVQAEAVKFLHSFFRGDRFIDNRTEHIKFSTKVPGLSLAKFNKIVGAGYVVKSKEKTVADFYEVAESFQRSARKLLVDGYLDARMKSFLASLR